MTFQQALVSLCVFRAVHTIPVAFSLHTYSSVYVAQKEVLIDTIAITCLWIQSSVPKIYCAQVVG